MKKHIKYKNNYLTNVIFKIEFSPILKLSTIKKSAAEEFQEYVHDRFPNVTFQYHNKYDFENSDSNITKQRELNWVFSDNNDKKYVELNAENLILSYPKNCYENFNKYLDDVCFLLNGIQQFYPLDLKWMGIRYINQINENEINETNIRDYINESLINNIIFDLNGAKFSQMITRLETIKNNYNLTFQYGFFNPAFPQPDFKKDFILDYDCKLPFNSKTFSLENIKKELIEMNEYIFTLFEYATTQKLKDLMEKEQ